MNKAIFFQRMDVMQNQLDEIRLMLFAEIKKMMEGKESRVIFEYEQPLVYHDGDSIAIQGLLDSDTADGFGEHGQAYDLSIAELQTDDIKMIAERLAQEVL